MARIVQKFGGTSVADVERIQAVARRIARSREEGHELVIVVSAMGHTTDQLTGERGHEPLHTLAAYRRDPGDPTRINFALNLTHETKSGTLRVGDAVAGW